MKKLVKILPVMLVVCVVFTTVFAGNIAVPGASDLSGTGSSTVTNAAKGIWSTILTIVQILAIAAVVFAGLRYMFASADQKADIKKSMGVLAIGAILVFAASTVLTFIQNMATEVL